LINSLVEKLVSFKKKYGSIELPGYTHMKKAMPSTIGLWAEAFIESMSDNKVLLFDVKELIDQSPLGTGAGYGLPIKVDRKITAELLGFGKIQNNPLYVQNSRGKFEGSILHVFGQILFDLNKMASDIILFSMDEFGYFEVPYELCTGSSIMPHKKNPDVLEIIRGKYHQIVSYELELKCLIGNLISVYNRDLQLTKAPTINGFEIAKESIQAMTVLIEKLKVNSEKCKKQMTKDLYSTKKVHDLVKKGIPFRDAYEKISKCYES
jgi:argininosuccinate lyase